jgi:hypothetical protein
MPSLLDLAGVVGGKERLWLGPQAGEHLLAAWLSQEAPAYQP